MGEDRRFKSWVIKQRNLFLRLKQFKERRRNLLERIYEPGAKEGHKFISKIWPVRPIILVIVALSFHLLNNYPIFSFNVVTIAELVYGLYILLPFIFSSRKLTAKTQIYRLILDLLFVSAFECIANIALR